MVAPQNDTVQPTGLIGRESRLLWVSSKVPQPPRFGITTNIACVSHIPVEDEFNFASAVKGTALLWDVEEAKEEVCRTMKLSYLTPSQLMERSLQYELYLFHLEVLAIKSQTKDYT